MAIFRGLSHTGRLLAILPLHNTKLRYNILNLRRILKTVSRIPPTFLRLMKSSDHSRIDHRPNDTERLFPSIQLRPFCFVHVCRNGK